TPAVSLPALGITTEREQRRRLVVLRFRVAFTPRSTRAHRRVSISLQSLFAAAAHPERRAKTQRIAGFPGMQRQAFAADRLEFVETLRALQRARQVLPRARGARVERERTPVALFRLAGAARVGQQVADELMRPRLVPAGLQARDAQKGFAPRRVVA